MDLRKELILASNDAKESMMLSRLLAKGRIRKLASKVYTGNLIDSAESIIRRNLFELLSWRFPGCIITHRSAQSLRPTGNGNVYITYTFTKRIDTYPGLVLNVMEGPGALESDIKMGSNNLYISSEVRWVLEVLQPARRGKDGESKGLSQEEVEHRLEDMLSRGGEDALNSFRDRARSISEELGMSSEFEKLTRIISALLSTHESSVLTSSVGKACSTGCPYDRHRIELFEKLYDSLQSIHFPLVDNPYKTEQEYQLFAFFESYFSNYIEGTQFELSEAKQIVDTGVSIPMRREDSHDILGTYRLLSNRGEMQLVPKNEDELIEILRYRHRIMLEERPQCTPGMFKARANQAGDTVFVTPELVEGTLRYGFRYYSALSSPLARAIYMMFLCSEVHPFVDGNGRIARMMMNAELSAGGVSRIIVPTVYREDYLLALRKMSRRGIADTYISVLEHLQEFSANIPCGDFVSAQNFLQRCNAFSDAEEAYLNFSFKGRG